MRAGWVIAMLLVLCTAPGAAQMAADETPKELEGIGIVDRAGEQVPPGLTFRDESGEVVRFGDYLEPGRPVIVQMVYFSCPMLCTLVLNGYLDGADGLDWSPGREYTVLSVSIDPEDTPELAAIKKENYVEALGKPEAAAGWHFLTGGEDDINALASALGFRYRWVDEQKEFAHAAGMFVLTPDGTISKTLYGIEFAEKDLRLSLVEAGEGKLGSPLDKLLLYCFQYDPETHRYSLVALNVMSLGALGMVIGLGGFLAVLWLRERSRPVHPAA